MTTGTTTKGYPYPNGDDPITNGDNVIKALADKLNLTVPMAMAVGTVSFPDVSANSVQSVQVNHPVGRFTTAPICIISPISGTPQARNAGCSPPNSTYFVAYLGNWGTGTVTAPSASYVTLQMGATTAPGLAAADADLQAEGPTVACTTAGCENEGIALPAATEWTDEDGTSHPVNAYQCGVCGQPITMTEGTPA